MSHSYLFYINGVVKNISLAEEKQENAQRPTTLMSRVYRT
jgi:hypothetical protein